MLDEQCWLVGYLACSCIIARLRYLTEIQGSYSEYDIAPACSSLLRVSHPESDRLNSGNIELFDCQTL